MAEGRDPLIPPTPIDSGELHAVLGDSKPLARRDHEARPAKAPASRSFDLSAFKDFAAGVQSWAQTAAILIGGLWVATMFGVLDQKTKARAEVDKLLAEGTEIRRRTAENKVVIPTLDATVVGKSGVKRIVQVTLTLRNTGNTPFALSLDDDARFYVARVNGIARDGQPSYGPTIPLQIDFPDFTYNTFDLEPGADPSKLVAIQEFTEPGVYLARFGVWDPLSKERKWMYHAETFFVVE